MFLCAKFETIDVVESKEVKKKEERNASRSRTATRVPTEPEIFIQKSELSGQIFQVFKDHFRCFPVLISHILTT